MFNAEINPTLKNLKLVNGSTFNRAGWVNYATTTCTNRWQ